MAYTLGNKCAKNFCKRIVLLQLIIENMFTCFFGTQCIISVPNRIFNRTKSNSFRTESEFLKNEPKPNQNFKKIIYSALHQCTTIQSYITLISYSALLCHRYVRFCRNVVYCKITKNYFRLLPTVFLRSAMLQRDTDIGGVSVRLSVTRWY